MIDWAKQKKVLVLQHFHAEHLGRFRPMFEADGWDVVTIALDKCDTIQDLDQFDAVWALGGPMQVWEEEKFPWLTTEKKAIHEAVVERKMPFFGLCLGHQLLADSLGGEVRPSDSPEVGILPIELTDAGKQSPFFKGFSDSIQCIQGHGAEVTKPPPGAAVLAQSSRCRIQALGYGNHAFSIQFHSELTLDMVDACLELPEYKADFDALLGSDGIASFRSDMTRLGSKFDCSACRLYENWKALALGK